MPVLRIFKRTHVPYAERLANRWMTTSRPDERAKAPQPAHGRFYGRAMSAAVPFFVRHVKSPPDSFTASR